MRIVSVVVLSLLALPLFAQQQTTITTTPATPAWGETFTFTVRGTWPNGCVPKFQSVTAGTTPNTIRINATGQDCASVCPTVVTQYRFETTPGVIQNPGIYTIEYHVIDATGVAKFRFDCDGLCHDCGKVGSGVQNEDGE